MVATALNTVNDYFTDARTLLQDTVAPNRYQDPDLLTALNVTMLEARRLRPDLFFPYLVSGNIPLFTTVDNTAVPMEPPFRLGILHGLVAHALERDQEDIQDARSAAFMQVFNDILVGGRVTGIVTPGPKK